MGTRPRFASQHRGITAIYDRCASISIIYFVGLVGTKETTLTINILSRLLSLSLLLSISASMAASTPRAPQQEEAQLYQRVKALLTRTPLIDGHNDLPWQYKVRVDNHLDAMNLAHDLSQVNPPTHTDLARIKAGMLGGQFWSVYIPVSQPGGRAGATAQVLAQIDLVHRLVAQHPHALALAYNAADIRRVHAAGKLASLIGIEGGHAIENSLAVLRLLYRAGARYMTLTHGKGLRWADSATDEARVGGLSKFGKEVVREMNRLGMLVDLSHVSPEAMHAALDTSLAPVIFSHSNAFAITPHRRNVPDHVLTRIPDNDGLVMVTFFPAYVSEERRRHREQANMVREQLAAETDDEVAIEAGMKAWANEHPAPLATLAQVADHIDYLRDVIGVSHIGIGSDFDGMPPGPIGLEDVSRYPALFVELLKRGYRDTEIASIAGENMLRVMQQAEAVAVKLQETRPASDLLIDELDGVDGIDGIGATIP